MIFEDWKFYNFDQNLIESSHNHMTYHNHVTCLIRLIHAVSKNEVPEQVILFHFVVLECLPREISPILGQHQPRMDMLVQLPLDKILISTLFHLKYQ